MAENKKIVRRFLEEVVNDGNYAIADKLVTEDFVDHSPLPGLPGNAEGFKQSFVAMRAAFPDMHYVIDDMVAEEDKVVVRWTASGTHQGSLMGIPPTGKEVAVTGVDIFRVKEGKLAELWLNWDQLGLMQQLGVIPPQ